MMIFFKKLILGAIVLVMKLLRFKHQPEQSELGIQDHPSLNKTCSHMLTNQWCVYMCLDSRFTQYENITLSV